MILLAVDTTSDAGSIALLEGRELAGILGVRSPHHAETLIPLLDRFLQDLGRPLSQIEAFAVAVGPGSFTGLRIGIATVEGLAFSTGRPVAGVSALDATAHRFRHRPGWVASMIDARRGEVYGALYHSDGEGVVLRAGPVCEPPPQFLARLPREPVLVAGTAIRTYSTEIASAGVDARLAAPSFFLAEEVARLGAVILEKGEGAPLGGLDALYIRPSDAERAAR